MGGMLEGELSPLAKVNPVWHDNKNTLMTCSVCRLISAPSFDPRMELTAKMAWFLKISITSNILEDYPQEVVFLEHPHWFRAASGLGSGRFQAPIRVIHDYLASPSSTAVNEVHMVLQRRIPALT
ncbi:MAG: hypothetical protein ACOVOX_11470 [Burkholderiaceae bacterium]